MMRSVSMESKRCLSIIPGCVTTMEKCEFADSVRRTIFPLPHSLKYINRWVDTSVNRPPAAVLHSQYRAFLE